MMVVAKHEKDGGLNTVHHRNHNTYLIGYQLYRNPHALYKLW